MCLIGLRWQQDELHLQVAANRDEFHDRPSAAAAWWPDDIAGGHRIFGGRDLRSGGSWLAIRPDGRLAAVTNVRRPQAHTVGTLSRGALVVDFLRSEAGAADFLQALASTSADYGAFNLLVHDGESLMHASNVPEWHSSELMPGRYGLSNADLDTPWPKVCRIREAMVGGTDHERLLAALGDSHPAADAVLPNTGVGIEMERMLSPPLILGRHYGTRASTIVDIFPDGRIDFVEHRFGPEGEPQGVTREPLA